MMIFMNQGYLSVRNIEELRNGKNTSDKDVIW